MKKVGMGLLLAVSCGWARAQFLGGIFSQGTTELKNNAAQIIALQALGATNQEGYEALEAGLTNIGDIHDAEYVLHENYFASLAAVNPQLAAMPEVAVISVTAGTFNPTLTAAVARWNNTGWLTAGELAAMEALNVSMTQQARQELETEQILLTAGELTMSDAERIHAIRKLAQTVTAQFEFIQQLCAEGDLLIANRERP